MGHPGGRRRAAVIAGLSSRLAKAGLFARTLAGLRPVQWLHLPLSRMRAPGRPIPAVPGTLSPEAFARFSRAVLAAGPGDPARRRARADLFCRGTLSLLGVPQAVDQLDLRNGGVSPLWSYHFHYLEWTHDLAWAFRATGERPYLLQLERILSGWIAANRGLPGVAWEAYPMASRSLALSLLLALVHDELAPDLRTALVALLSAQAAEAPRRLELHLQGNHLWRDIAAWVVATSLLEGDGWERARARAVAAWDRVRGEQLLPDGGHEERSPLYHALALQDLTLAVLALPPGAARDRTVADGRRMAGVLPALIRPDGRPQLFSDSAARDDLDLAVVCALARQADTPPPELSGPFFLPATGYAGTIDAANGDRLVMDCGAPAPRHQPGHLHCQMLALELDLGRRPILCNAGVAGYDGDPFRAYFRGTSAHSTVQVGAPEQSEIWGVFRVGRMAKLRQREAPRIGGDGWEASATMSPYAFPGVTHRRRVQWRPGVLAVEDEVRGAGSHPVRAYLHFHPDVELRPQPGGSFALMCDEVLARVEIRGARATTLVQGRRDPPQGWCAEAFGAVRSAPCLEIEMAGGAIATLQWRITRMSPP